MSRYQKNRSLKVFASQPCFEARADEGTLTMSSMSLVITLKMDHV